MNSQEYLKNQLDRLVESFPSIRVRYEDDISNNSHFVEITPLEVYKNDSVYQQAEDEITLDFIGNYPTENIVFISENSETDLTKLDYERVGSHFYNTPTMAVLSEFNNFPVNHLIFSDLFKDFKPDYFTTLHTNVFVAISQNMLVGSLEPNVFFPSHIEISGISNVALDPAGENNYALAA